jgi:hypothetical protein
MALEIVEHGFAKRDLDQVIVHGDDVCAAPAREREFCAGTHRLAGARLNSPDVDQGAFENNSTLPLVLCALSRARTTRVS